jgi:hypothetical protein
MDDLDDLELEGLLRGLKTARERRRSLELSFEDAADSSEGLDGDWTEWMCPDCGIFMKPHRRACGRCQRPRV